MVARISAVEPYLQAAQQYFPTYRLDPNRVEIGLREYDLAAKALEGDQRSLTAAAGIALFFSGIGASVLTTGNVLSTKVVTSLGLSGFIVLLVALGSLTGLASRYFALLQRSATHAARKIVVLRRLLGLDYGNVELVLPSDTLDGANEPFAISMFPGWSSLQAVPQFAVSLLAALALGSLYSAFYDVLPRQPLLPWSGSLLLATVAGLIPLLIYRLSLLEQYENVRVLFAKVIGELVKLPLKVRIGHVMYRLRLAVLEADRLKVDLASVHPFLVQIEDKRFYSHRGNDIIGVLSAVRRYFKYNALSGASTITQQLFRSNFLKSLRSRRRRKLLEWIAAPWLYRQFSQDDLLNAYLVSVRYASGVFGLIDAVKHYFPHHDLSDPLTPSMRFVLIERLSNLRGTFPVARIQSRIETCKRASLLNEGDVKALNVLYGQMGTTGVIDLQGMAPSFR